MTAEKPPRDVRSPWVGDQVHDDRAGRDAIVTDVRDGTYVLRPLHGSGARWTSDDPARLTVVVPRDQRRAEGRI